MSVEAHPETLNAKPRTRTRQRDIASPFTCHVPAGDARCATVHRRRDV